jgi:hypothetical protein
MHGPLNVKNVKYPSLAKAYLIYVVVQVAVILIRNLIWQL